MDDLFLRVSRKYKTITETLISRTLTVATAESCTGGLIASLLTDTAGASDVVRGGVVAYSNGMKEAFGVPREVIESFGVYSPETARSLASLACRTARSDIGIGVTGSLGRVDPHNPHSVPGEVFFCVEKKGEAYGFSVTDAVGKTRSDAKLLVADRIADALLSLIRI